VAPSSNKIVDVKELFSAMSKSTSELEVNAELLGNARDFLLQNGALQMLK
jgi:hypothetical protein